jgi:hypothetical protein
MFIERFSAVTVISSRVNSLLLASCAQAQEPEMMKMKTDAKVNNKAFFIDPPFPDASLSHGRLSSSGRNTIKARPVPAWLMLPFNHPERDLPSGEERMSDTAEQTGIFSNNQKQLRMPGWIRRLHSGETRHATGTAWIILILDAC